MQRPISVNMGMPMPGWFDILNLGEDDVTRKQDEPGTKESARCAPNVAAFHLSRYSRDLCAFRCWQPLRFSARRQSRGQCCRTATFEANAAAQPPF